jgi:two-component system, NtrC family, nitrogen regulation response regulator NtrX
VSARLLVVDDEPGIRRALGGALSDEGYSVRSAASAAEALERLAAEPVDLVMLDIWLEGMDGVECLRRIKATWPELPVVMISGHGTIETAVQCTRLGAYDFLEKPLSIERVLLTVGHALREARLLRKNRELRSELDGGVAFVGTSPKTQSLLELLERVAAGMPRVLIQGENGTGKELVARLLHRKSGRSEAPFVELNCAAIPEELIESELFGHERGSFTGAGERRTGKFELADCGTLFLDEVGDMSLRTQAKVLRALEEGRIQRVGGERPVAVDVWVLAATNKDLGQAIEEGKFREDLFYRLCVVPVEVPPLRERREDVPALVEHYMARFARGRDRSLSVEATRLLAEYDWPGNVRELRNLLERLALLEPGPVIGEGAVAAALRGGRGGARRDEPSGLPLREAREAFERGYIQRTIEGAGGNMTRAAQLLGLERSNFYRKLRQLGLAPPGAGA